MKQNNDKKYQTKLMEQKRDQRVQAIQVLGRDKKCKPII